MSAAKTDVSTCTPASDEQSVVDSDSSAAAASTTTSSGSQTSVASYQHALEHDGKRVIIGGVGGSICVDPRDRRTVTTSYRKGALLQVELIDENKFSERGLVAFKVVGTTNKYLSVTLYGDDVRNAIAEALSRTLLLPALIPGIIDFVVDRASEGDNFEGPGYNYQPMTAEDGPPGLLQVFTLERKCGGRFGIKSRFQTYWRSQHWNKTVSQAPHCLGDERWRLTAN
mmetsp:Transcript_4338/g.9791  ORF Transcript_4338/g.9791 Transcript_4338/m.9791 type:complete len:227 (+) Transcript_4338:187-867(+)|eukprot:CAMPEP_0178490788 /NCGR_PEP_ID=MMETSP0696-20121128/11070_1 /TAXON_ID=265572 /ORGANISM="Extubocellulus spinifer, Strain CCMP396" /LENGTH=226 /DNA_ID=CAMNT_0020118627 /DNA_START=116 /DNA_END=796 /DNA_ORIENTATION=+